MYTAEQRLVRMRESFANDYSILVEDYLYFSTPDAPTDPSKAARKSEAPSVRQSPKRS